MAANVADAQGNTLVPTHLCEALLMVYFYFELKLRRSNFSEVPNPFVSIETNERMPFRNSSFAWSKSAARAVI